MWFLCDVWNQRVNNNVWTTYFTPQARERTDMKERLVDWKLFLNPQSLTSANKNYNNNTMYEFSFHMAETEKN
jgi:hypothetical protein